MSNGEDDKVKIVGELTTIDAAALLRTLMKDHVRAVANNVCHVSQASEALNSPEVKAKERLVLFVIEALKKAGRLDVINSVES